MSILLSDNFDLKTLSEYLEKLNEIDNILDDILSRQIEIKNSEQRQSFISILEHLIRIDYSTEYVKHDIAKKSKEEQLKISKLRENISLKYYLLCLSVLSEVSHEKQFKLNRTLMGLNIYHSTFDRFLRFEDKRLLNILNKK